MNCYRKGCDRIMCRTYVNGVGYICSDCQKEFKEYLSSNGIAVKTEGEIKKELKKFIKSEKAELKSKNIDVDEFFNEYRKND